MTSITPRKTFKVEVSSFNEAPEKLDTTILQYEVQFVFNDEVFDTDKKKI